MTDKSTNSDWMNKFQDMVNSCQTELKKTTQIGMKMLSASQSNAQLKKTYEELGQEVKQALSKGDLTWSNEVVDQLLSKIDNLETELEKFENEVHDIKQASSSESETNP